MKPLVRAQLPYSELARIRQHTGRKLERCDHPRRALLCSPDPGNQAVHTFVGRDGRDEVRRRADHDPRNRLIPTAEISDRVAHCIDYDCSEFDKITKKDAESGETANREMAGGATTAPMAASPPHPIAVSKRERLPAL